MLKLREKDAATITNARQPASFITIQNYVHSVVLALQQNPLTKRYTPITISTIN